MTEEQAKCMVRYIAQQTNFEGQQSMANLMTSTIAKSMQEIRLLLPNWLSTSNMAYIIKTTADPFPVDWCTGFMQIGFGDETEATNYCQDSANPTNFTDVETLTQYVDGIWYGAEKFQAVEDLTGMDTT
jgi:hypothetical protein